MILVADGWINSDSIIGVAGLIVALLSFLVPVYLNRRMRLDYGIVERSPVVLPPGGVLHVDDEALENPSEVTVVLANRGSRDIHSSDFLEHGKLVLDISVPIKRIIEIQSRPGVDNSKVEFEDTRLKIAPLGIMARQQIKVRLLVTNDQQCELKLREPFPLESVKPHEIHKKLATTTRQAGGPVESLQLSRRTLLVAGTTLAVGIGAVLYWVSDALGSRNSATPPPQVNPPASGPATAPALVPPHLSATLTGHTSSVAAAVFAPGGATLASGSADKTVKLWNIAAKTTTATLVGHTDAVTSVAYTPGGTTLAAGSVDQSVILWSAATGARTATLADSEGIVNALAIRPDGAQLATGDNDNTVTLWSLATDASTAVLQGHSNGVDAVTYSPDGELLASGSGDETVILWAIPSGRKIRTLTGHTDGVTSVAFSPDGQTVASGGFDNLILLWNTQTGTTTATLTGHNATVNGVTYSPDGTILASCSDDGTVILWNAATHANIAPITIGAAAKCVAFSPDGKLLAVGTGKGPIQLWTVQ
jgi:WD40 repeat protein